MKRVCGLDVHKDNAFVCILGENGEKIEFKTEIITVELGIPIQCSRYLQETYSKKQENAHYTSRRYHYYLLCSFYLQVSEHFE